MKSNLDDIQVAEFLSLKNPNLSHEILDNFEESKLYFSELNKKCENIKERIQLLEAVASNKKEIIELENQLTTYAKELILKYLEIYNLYFMNGYSNRATTKESWLSYQVWQDNVVTIELENPNEKGKKFEHKISLSSIHINALIKNLDSLTLDKSNVENKRKK